jgi:hypothetical protein
MNNDECRMTNEVPGGEAIRHSAFGIRHWGLALLLASCTTLPEVPITTPKPLEVNLNMRLDVYQYRGDEPTDKEASKALEEANIRQRNRMSEIMNFKGNELVGEDHRGQLFLREVPAGKWGEEVKKKVSDENTDRMLIMRQKAMESNRTLQEVQDEQWKVRVRQANEKEWIEVAGKVPGTFQWVRAGEQTAAADVPKDATKTEPKAEAEKPGEAKAVP